MKIAIPEPGMLVGSVVHHQVEHHPDAAAVGFSNKAVKICKSAEAGIDIAVIGNVVTEVVFGTFKKGLNQMASMPSEPGVPSLR